MLPRIICLLFFLSGCKQEHTKAIPDQASVELGAVDSRLAEASGLVASIANPGFLWTINDSGNPAEVFLVDQHANIRLVCTLANIRNRDWEDISIDVGFSGKSYLYVADIGDNRARYEYKMIYRFEEPVLSKEEEKTITDVETFVFQMPDGKKDAETMLIDPATHDLFIISKSNDSTGLYQMPNPMTKDTMILKKKLSMPFRRIVAGSISWDGQKVLLKDYNKIYLWNREADESLVQLLTKKPAEVPYEHEPQGEAIAWSLDRSAFYTLSESSFGRNANLIRHK
jgi:hypothetical protein